MNVPDHTLNEEDLKEKRRQRLMKAGYDARIRAKAERDQEKAREAEAKRLDEEARTTDPQRWLVEIRQRHEVSLVPVLHTIGTPLIRCGATGCHGENQRT